jgi:hypothetical protein
VVLGHKQQSRSPGFGHFRDIDSGQELNPGHVPGKDETASMILTIFTIFHVVLSLIGIGAGFIVVFGLLTSRLLKGWTRWFLATTVLTSVTGFFFPVHRFLPSHAVAILSLLLLAVAIFALYRRKLAGGWRRAFAITAVLSLYLNFFVLIVQLFEKVPALKMLAPTQTEMPFKVAQLTALTIFVLLTILAAVKFRVEPVGAV